jgi:toluene monooxygenase system protein A
METTMALLNRSDWYDLARTTNWTPRYVTEQELFPPELAGSFNIPEETWNTYDEPYKVTYRGFVQ